MCIWYSIYSSYVAKSCAQKGTYQNWCHCSWLWWTPGNTALGGGCQRKEWTYAKEDGVKLCLSVLATWTSRDRWCGVRGRPVQCRMFSSIPGSHPLGDSRVSVPKLQKVNTSPDIAKCPKKGRLCPRCKPLALTRILENWVIPHNRKPLASHVSLSEWGVASLTLEVP